MQLLEDLQLDSVDFAVKKKFQQSKIKETNFRFSLPDTYPLDSVVYKWKEPGVITRNLVHQINQYTLRIERFSYNSTKYDDKGTVILWKFLRFYRSPESRTSETTRRPVL